MKIKKIPHKLLAQFVRQVFPILLSTKHNRMVANVGKNINGHSSTNATFKIIRRKIPCVK